MNTSRLFHFLFQGNLVKRIAVGLVLGILVALVNESVKNSTGIDLASSFGVLGQIFVKALRAVAPILIFFLVMAALANKKVGSKSNMKEIVMLYLLGTFLAAVAAVIASMAFPSDVALAVKEDASSAPQSVGHDCSSIQECKGCHAVPLNKKSNVCSWKIQNKNILDEFLEVEKVTY